MTTTENSRLNKSLIFSSISFIISLVFCIVHCIEINSFDIFDLAAMLVTVMLIIFNIVFFNSNKYSFFLAFPFICSAALSLSISPSLIINIVFDIFLIFILIKGFKSINIVRILITIKFLSAIIIPYINNVLIFHFYPDFTVFLRSFNEVIASHTFYYLGLFLIIPAHINNKNSFKFRNQSASMESMLLQLKYKFESGQITEYEYAVQKQNLLQKF